MSLSIADLDKLIDVVRSYVRVAPGPMFTVSPSMFRRMRRMERIILMYHAYPAPRYKIRKCHMRKLQARWHKARRRIHRIEQTERAQEEAAKEQTQ